LRKTKISFHAQLSQKIFPVLREKNSAKRAKVRKKQNLRENSENFAQKI